MSISTFEAKSDRKQWWFKLRRAKHRFLEAGLNMLIGGHSEYKIHPIGHHHFKMKQ